MPWGDSFSRACAAAPPAAQAAAMNSMLSVEAAAAALRTTGGYTATAPAGPLAAFARARQRCDPRRSPAEALVMGCGQA